MALLDVQNLSVDYNNQNKKIRAVDSVTFSFNPNESLGIAGESGSGKSSLGMAIMRSLQKNASSQGRIIFNNTVISEMQDREFDKNFRWKQISIIFQGAMNSLDPVFNIRSQFEEILRVHKAEGDHDKIIADAIASVGLTTSVLDKHPHEISGGMKQRVIIAMALLLSPSLVIADEPTTALDVLVQAQIISLLKNLKKHGLSIMLISHDLGIISEVTEKLAIMYAGQIVEYGDTSELLSKPQHPYTIALLESIPKLRDSQKIKPLGGNPPDLLQLQKGCRFYDRCPMAIEKCKTEPDKIKTKTGFVMCWLVK